MKSEGVSVEPGRSEPDPPLPRAGLSRRQPRRQLSSSRTWTAPPSTRSRLEASFPRPPASSRDLPTSRVRSGHIAKQFTSESRPPVGRLSLFQDQLPRPDVERSPALQSVGRGRHRHPPDRQEISPPPRSESPSAWPTSCDQLQPSAPLLTADQVAELSRHSRAWVYEHREELGAVRLGDGPRPRLRFPADCLQKLAAGFSSRRSVPPESPAPTLSPPRYRRRTSGRERHSCPLERSEPGTAPKVAPLPLSEGSGRGDWPSPP